MATRDKMCGIVLMGGSQIDGRVRGKERRLWFMDRVKKMKTKPGKARGG